MSPKCQSWFDRKFCHIRLHPGISNKPLHSIVFAPAGVFPLTFNVLFRQPRKTPVQIFYSTRLGGRLQSSGPTRGPPLLSQLPPGFHHLYSQIEYECASPYYQHHGSSRRTCLKTGKWSGRHVSCSPGGGSSAPVVWQPARTDTPTKKLQAVPFSHPPLISSDDEKLSKGALESLLVSKHTIWVKN